MIQEWTFGVVESLHISYYVVDLHSEEDKNKVSTFNEIIRLDIFKSILHHELEFDHPIWEKLSNESKDFIELALVKDYTSRSNAKAMLDHPWMRRFVKEPSVDKQIELDVADNLKDFTVIHLSSLSNFFRKSQYFKVEFYLLLLT